MEEVRRGAKRKLRLKLNVLGSKTNCSSHFPLVHPMYVVGHNNYRPRTSLSPTVDLTHNSLADTPAITDQILHCGRFYVAFLFPTACLQPIHAQVSDLRYAAAARTDTLFPTRAWSDTYIHALHRPRFNTLPVFVAVRIIHSSTFPNVHELAQCFLFVPD